MTPADAAARADRDAAATLARQQRTRIRHERGCYVVTLPNAIESRWSDDIDEGALRRFVHDGQACAAILAYRKANTITAWTIRCVTCGRDAFQDDDFTGWVDQAGVAMSADGVAYELVDGAWYCEEHAPDDEGGDPR